MMRSLYSGVSGLRNHQTRMDVIGNNIANVNTTGFKASRTVFQDIFSQTARSGSEGSEFLGGTNPIQIGLGIKLSTIDTLFTPGAFQRTDNMTDLTISGDGFFTISVNGLDGMEAKVLYSRAGNFYIDNYGHFVTSDGSFVLGYLVDFTGYYDADGNKDPTWGEVNDNLTNLVGDKMNDPPVPPTDPAWISPSKADLAKIYLKYQWDDALGVPDFAGLISTGKDPVEDITFTDIRIDANGVVWGLAKDELLYPIAKIALTTFVNNNGLQKEGDSYYSWTPSCGGANYGYARMLGSSAGGIMPGGLEMSNVDLANEFVDMIVTQRGFQANSRTITVSDTMLEELINLKR